jgi:hypothetical protein
MLIKSISSKQQLLDWLALSASAILSLTGSLQLVPPAGDAFEAAQDPVISVEKDPSHSFYNNQSKFLLGQEEFGFWYRVKEALQWTGPFTVYTDS